MEEPVLLLSSRKRTSRDLETPDQEEVPLKRACAESPSASPHLTLLEELYDLEEEETASVMPLESSTQEDLVAEMMKSLEKVIEEGEGRRGVGEASTSNPSEFASSAPSPVLEFEWSGEEIEDFPGSPQDASLNGELKIEGDLKEDAQIRELLQASDDELGLPASSSCSDFEENALHEDWASLANESSESANYNWLEVPFHQFDEGPAGLSKDFFEPLLLF